MGGYDVPSAKGAPIVTDWDGPKARGSVRTGCLLPDQDCSRRPWPPPALLQFCPVIRCPSSTTWELNGMTALRYVAPRS